MKNEDPNVWDRLWSDFRTFEKDEKNESSCGDRFCVEFFSNLRRANEERRGKIVIFHRVFSAERENRIEGFFHVSKVFSFQFFFFSRSVR